MVDMAADDALTVALLRLVGERLLELAYEGDRVLHLQLGPGGKRPVGIAERAAGAIVPAVDEQRELVGPVAEQREPFGVRDDDVELVAVDDEEAAPVGRLVDHRFLDVDATEVHAEVGAGELVVVARHEDDLGALAHLAQQLLHHVVVRLRPVPAAAQRPAVDDVADEVDHLRVVVAQEIDEELGLAAALAEVDVGDEEGAVVNFVRVVGHARPCFSGVTRGRAESYCGAMTAAGYDNCCFC